MNQSTKYSPMDAFDDPYDDGVEFSSEDEIEAITDPDLLQRGVTIDLLVKLAAEGDLSTWTTRSVVLDYILPRTFDYQCSLTGLLTKYYPGSIGRATHYVIHPWDAEFGRLIRMLEVIDARYNLEYSEKPFFFIDIFSVNQHHHGQRYYQSPSSLWLHRDELLENVRSCLNSIPFVILFMEPVLEPILVKRAWCLFECILAITFNRVLIFGCTPASRKLCLGDAIRNLGSAIENFTPKFEHSNTSMPLDKKWIFAAVDALNPLGVSWLNEQVGNEFVKWLTSQVWSEITKRKFAVPITSLQVLAMKLEKFDRIANAGQALTVALNSAMDSLGPSHTLTLSILHDFACYNGKHLKCLAQTKELLEDVLTERQKIFEPHHRQSNETMQALGRLCLEQDNFEDAEKLLRQVLQNSIVRNGFSHSDSLFAANHLALILQKQKKYSEASILYERVINCGTKLYGAKHHDVLCWRNNMAMLLLDAQKLFQAQAQFKEVLLDSEHALGVDHPNTVDIVFNYGQCLWRLGQKRLAFSMFNRELTCCIKIYGRNHDNTRLSINNVIEFIGATEGEAEVKEYLSRMNITKT